MSHIEKKTAIQPHDLEGDLSSITARMHVRYGVRSIFGGSHETTWRDRWDAFRAGRIYASLHKLFPDRYKEEEEKDRSNINRDYLESQLHEVPNIREFLSFLLGKKTGEMFPIKR